MTCLLGGSQAHVSHTGKNSFPGLVLSSKLKLVIYCLSYHGTCFSHVNTCEKSGQNSIVRMLCCQLLGGFKLGFDISDLPFITCFSFYLQGSRQVTELY